MRFAMPGHSRHFLRGKSGRKLQWHCHARDRAVLAPVAPIRFRRMRVTEVSQSQADDLRVPAPGNREICFGPGAKLTAGIAIRRSNRMPSTRSPTPWTIATTSCWRSGSVRRSSVSLESSLFAARSTATRTWRATKRPQRQVRRARACDRFVPSRCEAYRLACKAGDRLAEAGAAISRMVPPQRCTFRL